MSRSRPPLVVCVTCGTPLIEVDWYDDASGSPRSVHPDRTGIYVGSEWTHPARAQAWDHEPAPGLAENPADVAQVCDFCSVADPAVVWLTGGDVVIRSTNGDGNTSDWGASPWAACMPCSRAINAGNLRMLMARHRAMIAPHVAHLTRNERRVREKTIEKALRAFINSRPHGPFPLHPEEGKQ